MKKLNICNVPLSENEEYDIWWILSMYSLLRVSLYDKKKNINAVNTKDTILNIEEKKFKKRKY